MLAPNAKIIPNCPIFPGNKCSPMYSINDKLRSCQKDCVVKIISVKRKCNSFSVTNLLCLQDIVSFELICTSILQKPKIGLKNEK